MLTPAKCVLAKYKNLVVKMGDDLARNHQKKFAYFLLQFITNFQLQTTFATKMTYSCVKQVA